MLSNSTEIGQTRFIFNANRWVIDQPLFKETLEKGYAVELIESLTDAKKREIFQTIEIDLIIDQIVKKYDTIIKRI